MKMTRQKIDNHNLQKLLKKRIKVTRSILDLNNTTQEYLEIRHFLV